MTKKPFAAAPQLGTHLASLNLFREADGSVHITVASATGAISELDVQGKRGVTVPNDCVNDLIRQAIPNLPGGPPEPKLVGYMGYHDREAPFGEFETSSLTEADREAGWREAPIYQTEEPA